MPIQTQNPATEEIVEVFEPHSDRQVEQALADSEAAFEANRALSFDERARRLNAAADALHADCEKWAKIITLEMGKTLDAARSEVEKCASACRHYAQHAEAMLADEPVETDADTSYKRYLPLGPVLAVMPWNFPFWQTIRFAAPALMAGNAALLKHSSNVPQCALAIEEIFSSAGFPENAFQTLLLPSDRVAGVIKDRRVRAVTVTGSGPAGAAVAATAGEQTKKSVLELGGSDPFIVMPSADLDEAVSSAVKGRVQNNGQSCIAAKRFLVHRDVYDHFRDAFVSAFEALTVGDPTDQRTDVGPLAMASAPNDLDEQVQATVSAGAHRLTGAHSVDGRGYFYQPGIVENPPKGSPGFSDELFGPVAMLFKVNSLDEAIDIGNATPFGLGSAIFTQQQSDVDRAVNELQAGSTFVNQIVASDARLPFGGIKASGYGRELAAEGIREFVNLKTVSIL